jgi:predicted nucleotidyltransferase component of viral defense system
MITKDQINSLSRFYAVDNVTIMREYLQLIFLSYLYQKEEGRTIYFKGGTAIRLLFGSSRFSEDLDFSTIFTKQQIKKIVSQLEKSIQQEIPEFRIVLLYSGKETSRFRIKYQSTDFKYPLIVRLDFHHVRKVGKTIVSPLITRFPIIIFPLVSHLSAEEILLEKIQALISRGKGRDYFDVWYLIEKGIVPKRTFDRKTLLKKISQCSYTKLNLDLASFLPKPQRKLTGLLKERLQKCVLLK